MLTEIMYRLFLEELGYAKDIELERSLPAIHMLRPPVRTLSVAELRSGCACGRVH